MIWFALKACLAIATVAAGSVLLVDNVPFLKANILEVVNPRVQEGKLMQKLEETIADIDAATRSVGSDRETDALIAESKKLLEDIQNLNEEHAGLVDGVVSKVAEVLLGTVNTPVPATPPAAGTVAVTPEGCAY